MPLRPSGGVFQKTEQQLQHVNEQLNPGAKQAEGNKKPYYATGARCFFKLGGVPIGVCQDFRWQISYAALPIFTIDTPFAWDIDIGQVTIQATLTKIYDPLKGPESDSLFTIMAAAVHQPMVELQVMYQAPTSDANPQTTVNEQGQLQTSVDTTDFSMFFARGMFTAVSGNATLGQVSNLTAQFTGVAYQHYVSQGFTPYDFNSDIADALETGQNITRAISGGVL